MLQNKISVEDVVNRSDFIIIIPFIWIYSVYKTEIIIFKTSYRNRLRTCLSKKNRNCIVKNLIYSSKLIQPLRTLFWINKNPKRLAHIGKITVYKYNSIISIQSIQLLKLEKIEKKKATVQFRFRSKLRQDFRLSFPINYKRSSIFFSQYFRIRSFRGVGTLIYFL